MDTQYKDCRPVLTPKICANRVCTEDLQAENANTNVINTENIFVQNV